MLGGRRPTLTSLMLPPYDPEAGKEKTASSPQPSPPEEEREKPWRFWDALRVRRTGDSHPGPLPLRGGEPESSAAPSEGARTLPRRRCPAQSKATETPSSEGSR